MQDGRIVEALYGGATFRGAVTSLCGIQTWTPFVSCRDCDVLPSFASVTFISFRTASGLNYGPSATISEFLRKLQLTRFRGCLQFEEPTGMNPNVTIQTRRVPLDMIRAIRGSPKILALPFSDSGSSALSELSPSAVRSLEPRLSSYGTAGKVDLSVQNANLGSRIHLLVN